MSFDDDVKVVIPRRKFKKFQVHIMKEDCNLLCVICQNNVNTSEKCIALPACQHEFHRKCIYFWLCKYRAQCPQCRTEVEGGKPILRPENQQDLTVNNSFQIDFGPMDDETMLVVLQVMYSHVPPDEWVFVTR